MWEFLNRIPWRSFGMFILGAGGFLHELFTNGAERPLLLALSGALMGLPFFLSADQKRAEHREPPEDVDLESRWSHLP